MKSASTMIAALSLVVLSSVGAQPSVSKTTQAAMQETVVAKEREGLDALKAGNLEAFGKLTADDAVLIDARGPASRAQVMKNITEFRLTDYSIEDMKFMQLSPTTGLITYKISEQGSSHGHDFSAKAFVSSIWAKRAGGWVCVFSQETGTK
jgi:hypothetical protein